MEENLKEIQSEEIKDNVSLGGQLFGIIALVFSLIGPIAGIVFGLMGLRVSKKNNYATGIMMCLIAIVISIVVLGISATNLRFTV